MTFHDVWLELQRELAKPRPDQKRIQELNKILDRLMDEQLER